MVLAARGEETIVANFAARMGARLRRPTLGLLAIGTLLAGTVQAVPPASAAGTCVTKPDVFPVANLTKHMTATGYTSIDGTTVTSFDVEILGVLDNGIYPGVDFILAKITGPQSFLDETGGIVAGMSGSPVYIGTDLVGATSYGFYASGDSQQFMGITPAEAMVKLFDYPENTSAAAPRFPRTVRLSDALRGTAARSIGRSAAAFPATAQQVMLPLAVGGLTGRHFTRFSSLLARKGLPVLPYRSGTAAAPQPVVSATPLEKGDGFSAALSYGDFSLAGIGTTTATCGNLALAFGHPFFFQGRSSLGVNGADVLAIVKLDQYGGYKLANVTSDLHGTMDQDRLLGVREVDGEVPDLTPVTADITNPDLPNTRIGETDVVSALGSVDFFLDFPLIAAFSEAYEQDVAFDRYGDGSSSLGWTIQGTDPDGQPFTLTRNDKFFSEYDISFASIFELYSILSILQNNKFGDISFTHVSETATITQEQLTATITRVLSASSLQPRLAVHSTLRVAPGDTIRLRVSLLRFGETTPQLIDLRIHVPNGIRDGRGIVFVRGGRPECGGGFYFGRSSCKAKTFDGLLAKIAGGQHGNDLVGEMVLFARTHSGTQRFERTATDTRSRVVLGNRYIRIAVR
jgi:SpoIVB peptidase S55